MLLNEEFLVERLNGLHTVVLFRMNLIVNFSVKCRVIVDQLFPMKTNKIIKKTVVYVFHFIINAPMIIN